MTAAVTAAVTADAARDRVFTADPYPFDGHPLDDGRWAVQVFALLGVTLDQIRALDQLHAAAQHLEQDDLATEQVLEEAHFDPGADEMLIPNPDPLGSGWLSWREA
jgi:hypothetical protein